MTTRWHKFKCNSNTSFTRAELYSASIFGITGGESGNESGIGLTTVLRAGALEAGVRFAIEPEHASESTRIKCIQELTSVVSHEKLAGNALAELSIIRNVLSEAGKLTHDLFSEVRRFREENMVLESEREQMREERDELQRQLTAITQQRDDDSFQEQLIQELIAAREELASTKLQPKSPGNLCHENVEESMAVIRKFATELLQFSSNRGISAKFLPAAPGEEYHINFAGSSSSPSFPKGDKDCIDAASERVVDWEDSHRNANNNIGILPGNVEPISETQQSRREVFTPAGSNGENGQGPTVKDVIDSSSTKLRCAARVVGRTAGDVGTRVKSYAWEVWRAGSSEKGEGR